MKYIKPDEGYNIEESMGRKRYKSGNVKKFFVKIYNRKLRKYFKKHIESEVENGN